MTYFKRILTIILFFGLYSGYTPVLAQLNQPTTTITSQPVSTDESTVSKHEKDKDKEKKKHK